MQIKILAAVSENGIIGIGGKLPWKLSADLAHFRDLTHDHVVIMGRKTYDSILQSLGKPLPGRTSIVLSRTWQKSDSECVHYVQTFGQAIEIAKKINAGRKDTVYVIGGEEIYRLALPRASEILITLVHNKFQGDARFPFWETLYPMTSPDWAIEEKKYHRRDERNSYDYTFITYSRLKNAG